MMDYVCGLAFSPDHHEVVLIRKNRPSWQAGLLNGVGGKIEPYESAVEAMVREFGEETGVHVPTAAWRPVAVLQGPDFRVSFFTTTLDDVRECRSTTDETIVIAPTLPLPTDTMANLQWLVPLALDTSVATPVMVFHPSTNTSTRSPLARLLHPEAA